VRVIGPNGEQLGVMSSRAANDLAARQNLDLYCVAPNAVPPVCKILNYGKFRFEQQKQERQARKNQHVSELKQIQLSPVIGEHDVETKARKAREFLEDGDKVQVCVIFKGRQLSHKEVGEDVMSKFVALLADVLVPLIKPLLGRKMVSSYPGTEEKIGGFQHAENEVEPDLGQAHQDHWNWKD
jgi:translation initiation factor IF-3